MSHIDQGPLPAYSSLTDNNLSGYFASTRMRSHLKKAGLITKHGEIVSENTYRLNMGRKEHKKHVKDMLAQAIVHKTLDLERSRQAEIRKKLEEIAKIELVRRVRNERHRQTDENVLPYLSSKTSKAKTKRQGKSGSAQLGASSSTRGSQSKKGSHEPKKGDSVVHERTTRDRKRENYVLPLVSPRRESSCHSSITSASSSRPATTNRRRRATKSAGGSPSRRGKRPISALSSNYDDENETVVYLDDEGRPISPAHIDRSEMKYSSKDPIDTRHLYSLDTAALRKYAMLMAKMEQGRGGLSSPYLIPQVPLPPKSPRSGRAPLSAHRHRTDSDSKKFSSPKRPATASQAYLHPAGGPRQIRGQQETMCEVFMEYHGSSLSLVREQFDKRQDVIVEQQHCGGNTLTVFRDKMEAGTKFSFISYRHRGYPFSLSIYIDGKIDCRVSVCCEDRHSKGGRIGGKKGHFSVCSISGAIPCYKCQVEKGIRVKSSAPRRKLKRPPQTMEEVTVVATQQETEEVEERTEPIEDRSGEEILVPVDDDDDKNAGAADYDEDFEESEEEGYIYNEAYHNERGDSDEGDSDDYDDDDFDDDDDDDESKRRVIDDAADIIRTANKLIKESAISEEKAKAKQRPDRDHVDGDGRGERTKRRAADKRRGRRDDDDGDDYSDDEDDAEQDGGKSKRNYSSISSMGEDEDYYAYKERMLRKLEEQEKKSKTKKQDKNDVKVKKSNSKSDGKEESYQSKQQVDKNGKKASSTSSALGQAEPVGGAGSAGERGNKKRKSAKRGTRGNNNNEDGDGSGSDVRDTADEVSDIESEMAAASPRKADSVTNLAGPQLSSNSRNSSSKCQQDEEGEGFLNFQPKDARGVDRTTGRVDINDTSSSSSSSSSSHSENEDDRRAKTPTPHGRRKKMKKKKKGQPRNRSGSSSSSSASSSDTAKEKSDDEKKTKKETKQDEPDGEKKQLMGRFFCAQDKRRSSEGNSSGEEGGGAGGKSDDGTYTKHNEEPVKTLDKEGDEDKTRASNEGAGAGVGAKRVSMSSDTSDSSSSSDVSSGNERKVKGKAKGSSDDYSDSKKEEVAEDRDRKSSGPKVVDMGHEDDADDKAVIESQRPITPAVTVTPVGAAALADSSEKTEVTKSEDAGVRKTSVEHDKYYASEQSSFFGKREDDDDKDKKEEDERESSSSSPSPSSSSGSATIHDKGPNTVNDPTLALDERWREENENGTSAKDTQPEDSKDQEKDTEEKREKPKVLIVREDLNKPAESGSSSSSSSSSEDSDSDEEKKKGKKTTTWQARADVHQSESQPESDPEATHGGNDPDNVANGNGDVNGSRTLEPAAPAKANPGSIRPLLEASQTTLEIKGVTLNKSQVYEVAEFLERKSGINSVNLVNCGIDDDDVQKLMEALQQSPSNPMMLNLGLNPLTVECVHHILTACKHKRTIEAVLLQGTRLGDEGVNALIGGMMAQLNDRKMRGEPLDKGINELDLSDCKFGDQGALGVARLLTSALDIDTLTLTHNHAISSEGWRAIGDALKLNSNLETLTLDHNYIGDEGIDYIAQGLFDNTSVTAIDINDVSITDKGGKSIMELLKRNTYLLEITCMENRLSDATSDNIQKYISLNKASFSPTK